MVDQSTFVLKNVKQKITRQLNILTGYIEEAQDFHNPWDFPSQTAELEIFLYSNKLFVQNLISKLREKKEHLSELYAACNCSIQGLVVNERLETGKEFDDYWADKKGDEILSQAEQIERHLEKRLIELNCQEQTLKHALTGHFAQTSSQVYSMQITGENPNSLTLDRRLLGNELKIPTFHGDPSEFSSFWELFEELVHKQPYSNIEKLAILLNCCKGDAARTLQMIPRTGNSYERAIMQLKNQYEDPRRITLQMIRQLKTLRQKREDHRSARNNLNDIQAIISTLEKHGEVINTTNMKSMVLDTFSQNVQEEMAKREFDSGKIWTMNDLLENLNIAVKRREHVESFRESQQEERSIFHTRAAAPIVLCTGCGQHHKFQYCTVYPTITQKIERLKKLNACWKCLSRNHRTQFCRKQNCPNCGGMHNFILCRKGSNVSTEHRKKSNQARGQSPRQGSIPSSNRSRLRTPPNSKYRSRSYSPSKQGFGRNFKHSQDSRIPYIPCLRGASSTNQHQNSRSASQSPDKHRVRFQQPRNSRSSSRSPEKITVNLQLKNDDLNSDKDSMSSRTDQEEVRLMVVPIRMRATKRKEETTVYGLVDSASDQSFISTNLAEELELEIQKQTTIVVHTFGGRAENRKVKKVAAQLFNFQNDYIAVELLTSDKITTPLKISRLSEQDISFIRENYSIHDAHLIAHQRDFTISPEILIGMDYFNTIMNSHEPVYRLPSGLYITSTFFGPVVSGTTQEHCNKVYCDIYPEHIAQTCTTHRDKEPLNVCDLWKLSTIGIEDMSTEEEINNRIVSEFYSTVQLHDNKIFVRFPWKPNKSSLANNYNLALSRLHQLFKMKDRNPQCWKEYCQIIEEQLEKNFIEDAPRLPHTHSNVPCYYIPHQAVIKTESSTTKTRIVLDASSKMRGELSLNDVIYQGPLILPALCGILIRSRIGSKILIADVEKAFHMIHLQETERDAVRFLWLKDVTLPPSIDNIRILRFCRLPFGINASPFLLGISIKYGIEKQASMDKILQKQLNDNLYVDNVLLTDNSTDSLIRSYRLCKKIFNNMSMNLRQFLTNDELCNSLIPNTDLSNSSVPKILGVPWNHKTDSFTIKCKLKQIEMLTKRSVLQATHSTFDPLGLLTPLLLSAKVFLQDLWKRELKWDDPLSASLSDDWKTICQRAAGFEATVPRAITAFAEDNRYELHTFVDASMRAYAAATYLRANDRNGINSSALIMARQRLAPINKKSKTVTVPRLELLALTIGVRLTDFILHEIQLPIKEICIYSDSQVALHWVQSSNKNGVFVDNRCKEIRDKMYGWSNNIPCHLLYIPSHMNPADCATKGLSKDQFTNHEWWNGPPFLKQKNSQWPTLQEFQLPSIEADSEDNQRSEHKALCTITPQINDSNTPLLTKEFSSITKHKRIAALVLKYLRAAVYDKISSEHRVKLRKAVPELAGVNNNKPLAQLQANDLSAGAKFLIKDLQKTISQTQLERWDYLYPSKDDEGFIRCNGRIRAQHLAKETLHPILLPPNHNLTRLLIKDAHIRCGHQGVNGTLANIRLTYWIPKGRQEIKKQLKSCLVCRKWNSKPYFYPNSPPLPQSRTQPSRPFSHIGIDLAGPFIAFNTERSETKKWIFLATCMVTRAIHLEVTSNLSSLEIINVLRRMIARRGKPKLIISDNATTFTMGQNIIQTIEGQNENSFHEVENFLTNETIQWKFITPLSPWKGGFYERMIGLMKSTLKKLLPKQLSENEFVTLVTECEAMVNSRPLTYSGSSLVDSIVIRPIDFLIPYSNVNLLPDIENVEEEQYLPKVSTKEETLRYFTKHIKYLNQLWKFWTNHYLLELRNFHQRRIKQKTFTRKQPYLGEVVLVMDHNTPRGEWPTGLVTKLLQDADGMVRSVELKTRKSNITRPVNMLIPLEIEEGREETYLENKSIDERREKESIRDGVQCTKSAATNDEAATSSPACEVGRRRVFLPRRAKENRTYNVDTTRTEREHADGDRSGVNWHHWLLLAILAILTMITKADQNTISCTKGGVIIETPNLQDRLQVCANEYCMEVDRPDTNLELQFPAEITLHAYRVVVKSLKGNTSQALHWACPPSPFCEQITCTFCTVLIANPECWPRLAILITAILLYAAMITIYITVRTVRKIWRVLTSFLGIRSILRNPFKNLTNRRPSYESIPLTEITARASPRWSTSTIIRVLSIASLCCTMTYACQQTITIPSQILQCDSQDNTCINQTTVVAKMNTMKRELCLQLKHKELQIHMMKITLQELILRCQKETLYFTQNTQTRVQYRKRCPHMGTCSGLKCAKIKPDTKIDELEIANNFTGITYCSESCGGLGCSCGFPSSGCLFYRIYHVPVDDIIYEVFQCPSWYETAKVVVEQTHIKHGWETYTGEIKPYSEQRFGSTQIQITSFSVTPLSVLNKRFITNRKTTARLSDEHSFTYACATKPNSIGHDNCSIKNTCSCNPAEDSVTCYCTHNNISEFMQLSNLLPLPLPNAIVEADSKGLPKVHTTAFSLELAIRVDPANTQIIQNIQDFACEVVPTNVTGCYGCTKGAMTTIRCTANVAQGKAQVSCRQHQFILTCTSGGTQNNIQLFFNVAKVDELCRVQCGRHTTLIEIKGTLNYIGKISPIWRYIKLWGNESSEDVAFGMNLEFPDINHFLEICKSFYVYTVVVALTFSSVIVISAAHLCADRNKGSRNDSRLLTLPFAYIASSAMVAKLPVLLLRSFLKLSLRVIRIPLRLTNLLFRTIC